MMFFLNVPEHKLQGLVDFTISHVFLLFVFPLGAITLRVQISNPAGHSITLTLPNLI